MNTLASLLLERPLLLDGGMGTQILARKPTVDDFGGLQLDGCMEIFNERRPEWIRNIHAAYFDAGADAVETNTFGANDVVLGEFAIAHRTEEINLLAARLAKDVARSYDRTRFVVGSVGPGTKLITLGHIDPDSLFESYRAQVRGLLLGGADSILIETCQDLGQVKTTVRAARAAMADTKIQRPLWVQVTVEATGTLLLGTEIFAALTAIEMLGVDALGLNCGTGPDEMYAPLATLAEASPFLLSCLPNAGMPVNESGNLIYPQTPEIFAEKVAAAAKTFGLNIVGGCCGTTPAHIRALAQRMANVGLTRRTPSMERSVSSLYQGVTLRQEPRPLIVGERTNANGSKAFRDALAKDDFDALVGIAKDQQREASHMLDVCVAYVGRDEVRDMDEFLKRLVTQCTLPLMIDSTEPAVIERALKLAPGKCVVNSINFEDGEGRARQILDLCRTYGAAVVALTIDEQGMAQTLEQKLVVAQRLVDLVIGEYKFNPSDLIIDPLTFTLGSGDEAYRRSAIATLDAIREIKARHPGVLTMLGVSNVSFGLKPAVRHVVNALMLYHGVQAGLDLAIFNSGKVIPVARIPEDQRRATEDLLFDRRSEGYDPLKVLLEIFGNGKVADMTASSLEAMDPSARLRQDILDGEKQRVLGDVDEALKFHDPLHLINEVLLGAMKEVGERFGAGTMQLPFVLESAETMKAAISRIEPLLPKESSTSKGRIVLATVKGDVHDIGKNLVDIILSNNGYEVANLGIKQPVEAIMAAVDQAPTLAVGLSGLLVKSTAIMRENLISMAEKGYTLPVILGGAALTRDFVEQECRPLYKGPVRYAEDAFEGLRILDASRSGDLAELEVPVQASKITVLRRGEASVPLTPEGRSSWVKRSDTIPEPPFWGVKEVAHGPEDLFEFLDTFVVIRNRWSFTQGQLSDADFDQVIKGKAEPLLASWKQRLLAEPLLRPRARYGYFPVQAAGDVLKVFAPDRSQILSEFVLPRQAAGRRLCIADYFEPVGSSRFDVMGLQLVTLGRETAEHAAKLYAANQYSDYFSFHGLATELTEAYAELIHSQIRRELGIHQRDAKQLRQLFSQGYQGSRYSFGYPACPDLEGNVPILELLQGAELDVEITEGFQMVPEYTTSALVTWHPQARYFAV